MKINNASHTLGVPHAYMCTAIKTELKIDTLLQLEFRALGDH